MLFRSGLEDRVAEVAGLDVLRKELDAAGQFLLDQVLHASAGQTAIEVGPAGATCDLLEPVQDATGGADVEAVLTEIANTYFGGDFNAMYIWAANECGVAFE